MKRLYLLQSRRKGSALEPLRMILTSLMPLAVNRQRPVAQPPNAPRNQHKTRRHLKAHLWERTLSRWIRPLMRPRRLLAMSVSICSKSRWPSCSVNREHSHFLPAVSVSTWPRNIPHSHFSLMKLEQHSKKWRMLIKSWWLTILFFSSNPNSLFVGTFPCLCTAPPLLILKIHYWLNNKRTKR